MDLLVTRLDAVHDKLLTSYKDELAKILPSGPNGSDLQTLQNKFDKLQAEHDKQQRLFDACKADYALLLECHFVLKTSWEQLRIHSKVLPQQPSSDDMPELVLERPVKGRSRQDKRKRIKIEPLTDSNSTQREAPQGLDSIDLDELGATMVTPRKSFRGELPSASPTVEDACATVQDSPKKNHEKTLPRSNQEFHDVEKAGRQRRTECYDTRAVETPDAILQPLDVNILANAKSAPAVCGPRFRGARAIQAIAEDCGDTPSRSRPTSSRLGKLLHPRTRNNHSQKLRSLPLERLGLADFRLNPQHQHFAYHETIRKHDEKKARGGCTEASCERCQELARFMAVSGYGNADDETMLCAYLGKTNCVDVSAEERARLLPIARQAYVTEKFGKHRQGQRSMIKEPPGFWDTDFPSTQDNRRLQQEADLMERAKVQERWNEAMRSNGKWIFADES